MIEAELPYPRSRKILLIDHQTGRAHALCDLWWRTDPDVVIYYGPGHTALRHDRLVCVPQIDLADPGTVIEVCNATDIDLVFVSWIDSLTVGFVDALLEAGIRVIGPSRMGALLEASKRRGKQFCLDHRIPVAPHATFDVPAKAVAYVRAHENAVVVKEDGLTKVSDGAHLCVSADDAERAIAAVAARMGENFAVVIERRLEGQDVSLSAFTDGKSYLMLPPALDYKRADDGDRGINCDGMGTIAPHPAMTTELLSQARRIFDRIMDGLSREQIHYTGFIYVGAMIVNDSLTVLEINSRLGDSEAQVILPGVHNNFTDVCDSLLAGRLAELALELDSRVRCNVVAVQGTVTTSRSASQSGWPFGPFETGHDIRGIDEVDPERARVFLAGAELDDEGRYVTTRGRVLHVVGGGESLPEAVRNAYEQLARISFPGLRCRRDIGVTETTTMARDALLSQTLASPSLTSRRRGRPNLV